MVAECSKNCTKQPNILTTWAQISHNFGGNQNSAIKKVMTGSGCDSEKIKKKLTNYNFKQNLP